MLNEVFTIVIMDLISHVHLTPFFYNATQIDEISTFFSFFFLVSRNSSVGIATGYWLDGPGIESRWGARSFAPVQTGPGAHTASCTMCTGSFPRVKSGRGVTLTPHPLLVPWSRKRIAIPLLPLWAVRSVQSLSACTGVHLILPACFHLFVLCT